MEQDLHTVPSGKRRSSDIFIYRQNASEVRINISSCSYFTSQSHSEEKKSEKSFSGGHVKRREESVPGNYIFRLIRRRKARRHTVNWAVPMLSKSIRKSHRMNRLIFRWSIHCRFFSVTKKSSCISLELVVYFELETTNGIGGTNDV